MVFAYYNRLSGTNRKIYRESDRIETVQLNNPEFYQQYVKALRQALESANRRQTEKCAARLLNLLAEELVLPELRLRILQVRPANRIEELHGLYEPGDEEAKACITAWMKTAQRKNTVAFRSFLRTLLHEFCHHLDYEYFHLPESFHTEGFFKRESHIFRQLMAEEQALSPPDS